MAGSNLAPAAIPLLKSCESCRQRKIKCSGDKPTCAHCARRHQPCIYRRSARYKRRVNKDGGGAVKQMQGMLPVSAMHNESGAPGKAAGGADTTMSIDTTGLQMSSTEDSSMDENMPLSALFNTGPMNESDILPPSILQSMNFWMNDSLLTGATTAANVGLGIPAQMPMQFPAPAPSAAASDLDILKNLIPMDIALGLPAFTAPTQFTTPAAGLGAIGGVLGSAACPATASAGVQQQPQQQQQQQPPPPPPLGLPTDFLQQFSQPLTPLQMATAVANGSSGVTASGSPYPAAGVGIGSPGALFGTPASATGDLGSAMMSPFPTSAFASLNLVNSLDLQRSMQGLQGAVPGSIGNEMSVLGNPLLSPSRSSPSTAAAAAAAGVAGVATALPLTPVGGMHPVSASVSAAGAVTGATHTAAALPESVVSLPFRQSLTFGAAPGNAIVGGINARASVDSAAMLPRHNSMPLAQQAYLSSATPLPTVGVATSISVAGAIDAPAQIPTHAHAQQTQQTQQAKPRAQRPSMVTKGSRGISPPAVATPLSLSMIQGTQENASGSGSVGGGGVATPSPGTALTPGGSPGLGGVAQMNNDTIPQILYDVVAEHPELGSAELIYNLLITHVVHDCSRIGIYAARLFWMRVKQYALPKFYLYASIADASRSWTQSDAQRAAMPANLDETCYALAMQHATQPTASESNVLNALGMLTLAAYEFKSARFAAMVEHNCLAGKMMTQIRFRGASFPWRGAVRRVDAQGLDANYQLLIRAFWRIYISLFFASEIFRLDTPEDRDFLPEFPQRDNDFVHSVFVPDASEEFGFRMVATPSPEPDHGHGDLNSIVCELFVRLYKVSNLFNRVLRGEKTCMSYLNYLREWDRQMLEWRASLPPYLKDDLEDLARRTKPLDGRRRRMDLSGLSEDAMWRKRHQWNREVGSVMEVLYVHMMFEVARIKAHRVALMILLHEDLEMVRNFQNSRALSIRELPRLAHAAPILATYAEDAEYFRASATSAADAADHVYAMLKFSHRFGFDLHAYTIVIIGTLMQVSLVYVGQVQSRDSRTAWNAMLKLARILSMIRSLDRWGPALYIFTNILKALGRPDLTLQMPSPDTSPSSGQQQQQQQQRSLSADLSAQDPCIDDSCFCKDGNSASGVGVDVGSSSPAISSSGKRKTGDEADLLHGDEKRYEFSDHHHGVPNNSSPSVSTLGANGYSNGAIGSPAASEEDDVTNPFPPDHVITHIMREQKVSTATFFSPTLPILAASLLHNNSGGGNQS
ncbi:hypothetical protein GGI07_002504 [Coemansia sp. Benny D115]|nr:hypothetical protein GGI07_002504 [Coemansia sp. Benny D115]